MQIFLGDEVTIVREIIENKTFITGQVAGVRLTDSKQIECIWIHGIDGALYMRDGWRFVEEEDIEDDEFDD